MDPNQPNQAPQPQQPAPVFPPAVESPQPVSQPAAPVQEPQPPQPQPQAQFGGQAPLQTADQSSAKFKMVKDAGRAVFILGIFYTVLFTLTGLSGAYVMATESVPEGSIVLFSSLLNVILGVVLIVMGSRLKKQLDLAKASSMMKSMAIGIGVLAVLSLLGQAWVGALLLGATAGYLFFTNSKISKAS